MADPVKPKMRPVYAFRRTGMKARSGKFVEVGEGRIDEDGTAHIFTDRTAHNFTGYILMPPLGKGPPVVQPVRPGDPEDDEPQD